MPATNYGAFIVTDCKVCSYQGTINLILATYLEIPAKTVIICSAHIVYSFLSIQIFSSKIRLSFLVYLV